MNNNPTDSLVSIQGLHFARGQRAILEGVDIEIPRGKITAIMGPSGTGKTTVLKLIGAQLSPKAGKILVDGQDIHKASNSELYKLRRRMGLLFQNGALFTNLTVGENVAFPIREHTHLSEDMIHDLVLMKLEAVGLRGAVDLMPGQLSGGMARRVALARTIALDPELIMYDEPFAGQDPISMGVIVKLIKELNSALGLTSVIVSHDVDETASIADYIYILANGKIVGRGTPSELAASDSPHVKQFMGGLPDGVVPFHYPAGDYYSALLHEVKP